MPIVVVLGTGTHVGKTYVATQLVRALKQKCPTALVAAAKPIESGYLPDAPSDARALADVSTGAPLPPSHPLYAFEEAVSPSLASWRARLEPANVEKVREWVSAWQAEMLSRASTGGVWLLIETAGAAFSPLAVGVTNADLALSLEPCLWVLVAPDALGVLHDVTTTLATLRQVARTPDALVLSASRNRDASTGTNADELRRLGIADPVGSLAHGDSDLGDLAGILIDRAKARGL